MKPLRAVWRRNLDRRLSGLDDAIGQTPARGWIWVIRDALGMSTYELAQRMGVAASTVSQLEAAERRGSIQLSSLGRAARGLSCELYYVLVPEEPLELVVRRQALDKAARLVAARAPQDDVGGEDTTIINDLVQEQVEALAYDLIDQRGLWRDTAQIR